jgi:predicted nucleic-acid-binding Zn-ribbon protein
MDCPKCGSSMFFKDEVLFDGLDYMNGYYDCLICGEKEYTEVFGLFDSLKEVV